jgi:hypothetical protein
MAVFNEIKLQWRGEAFAIPPGRVLGAIAEIEEIITFHEVLEKMAAGRPPVVPIARAYGAVLRYAGAEVSDEQVYEGMFMGETVAAKVTDAVHNLLLLMMPPAAIVAANKAEADRAALQADAEARVAAKKSEAASKRLRRSTKRLSSRAA